MSLYLKATPRTIIQGIQDVSRRTPVPVPVQIPTHLPHFYLLAERGDSLPHIAVGAGFNQMYGIGSLDPLSPFATHATMGARQAMSNGNMCQIQRIIPPNARKSLLRFSVEMIPTKNITYTRDASGNYVYDDTGAKIPVLAAGTPVTTNGFRLVWHVGTNFYVGATLDGSWQLDGSGTLGAMPPGAVDRKLFGKATVVTGLRNGDVTGVDNEQLNGWSFGGEGSTHITVTPSGDAPVSVLFPIFDLEAATFGSHGDLKGVIFNAPNSYNEQNGDTSTMEVIKAYLYRLFMIERDDAASSPALVETLLGDQSVDLTFKPNVLHPLTKQPLTANRSVIPPYENLKDKSIVPIYGPFGRIHTYDTNIKDILDILISGSTSAVLPSVWANLSDTLPGESSYNAAAEAYGREPAFQFTANRANDHLLNFFTGVDQNNIPFFSFDVDRSVNFGGVALGNNAVHYASGGSDGIYYDEFGQSDRLRNLEMFDALVRTELKNFGSLEAKVLDDARYPLSTIWDTGFSLPTKKAMFVPMSLRKDIFVALASQSVADYANPNAPVANTFAWSDPNDGGTESSLALILSEAAAVYPESEIYGTPVCRAIIVGRTGELLNTTYQGQLPFSIDVIDKVSKYMGAGDGKWKSTFSFSSWPSNVVTLFADANITWRTPSAYDKDWENGLIWVQYFDTLTLYYPAFQTVYKDDTSVLNSFFTMAGCVELTKICTRVVRELQGDDKLTDLQFMQKSNQRITALCEGKFDERFIIRPETFKTASDTAYGFSWTVKAHLYANNMRTVGQLTVVVHRREELETAA